MTYKIEKQIESYLNGNYPFALMINGKWGSGKTYYLKNILEKNLKDISKGSLKSLCYISCNGVRSIDELKNNLTLSKLSSYTSLSESKLKLVKKIKDGISTFLPDKLSGLVSIGLKDINLISTSDLLIIDDLERRHSSLTIEEILGFVSVFYTELNNIKVIIVADEEKLLKSLEKDEQKKHYHAIKEKTIYRTIDFNEDLTELFNSIVENLANTEHRGFLKEKSEFIIGKCKVYEEKNLRTIGFFIDSLKILFEKFDTEIQKDTDNVIINSMLILCIQYKSGISFYFNKELKNYYKEGNQLFSTRDTLEFSLGDKPTEYEIEADKFSRKFIHYTSHQDLYCCFESLFNYIEFGVIDDAKFKQEYKEFCKRYDKHLAWQAVLEKFNDYRKFDTDELFDQNFKELNVYIKENKYNIYQLYQIAYIYENWKIIKIIGEFDETRFYQDIESSIQITKDEIFRQKQWIEIDYQFSQKITSDLFVNLRERIKLIEEEYFNNNNNDELIKLLEKYRNSGIIEEYEFQVILNFGTNQQIENFCNFVLISGKHLDTFCDKLCKNLSTHYKHSSSHKPKINIIIKSLQQLTKSMRIAKFRIDRAIEIIKN